MAWKKCPICHWSHFAQIGPEPPVAAWSALSHSKKPPAQVKTTSASIPSLPTGEDLIHRWQMAKTSASKPKHVRIEKDLFDLPQQELSRTRPHVDACKASWEGAYTLLPNQWPPLGVPPQVLALYDTSSGPCPTEMTKPHHPGPSSSLDVPMGGVAADTSSPPSAVHDSKLATLSNPQLKLELSRLEKSLADTTLATQGSPLRTALTQAVADVKAELVKRRPAGQQLDQALARERSAKQAREAAEKHVVGLEQSLAMARASLQQTQHTEELATAETGKIRAQLAETEPASQEPSVALPVEVTSAILGILRQAGITPNVASPLLQSMGFGDLPPTPPLPVPLNNVAVHPTAPSSPSGCGLLCCTGGCLCPARIGTTRRICSIFQRQHLQIPHTERRTARTHTQSIAQNEAHHLGILSQHCHNGEDSPGQFLSACWTTIWLVSIGRWVCRLLRQLGLSPLSLRGKKRVCVHGVFWEMFLVLGFCVAFRVSILVAFLWNFCI